MEAANRAAASAGTGVVTPEMLLDGILAQPGSLAGILLRELQVTVEDVRRDARAAWTESAAPPPEVVQSAEVRRALRQAEARAGQLGEGCVNTGHLLLGLLDTRPNGAAEILARYEIDIEPVVRMVGRIGKCSEHWSELRPTAVSILVLVMLLLSVFNLFVLVVGGSCMAGPFDIDTLTALGLLGVLWTTVCCGFLVGPLASGRQWSWAGTMGGLFVKCAAGWSGVACMVAGPALELLPMPLLYSIGVTLLARGLFQARGWFGIGEREGWRTMLRRGWWALLITAVLDFSWWAGMVWVTSR